MDKYNEFNYLESLVWRGSIKYLMWYKVKGR